MNLLNLLMPLFSRSTRFRATAHSHTHTHDVRSRTAGACQATRKRGGERSSAISFSSRRSQFEALENCSRTAFVVSIGGKCAAATVAGENTLQSGTMFDARNALCIIVCDARASNAHFVFSNRSKCAAHSVFREK